MNSYFNYCRSSSAYAGHFAHIVQSERDRNVGQVLMKLYLREAFFVAVVFS